MTNIRTFHSDAFVTLGDLIEAQQSDFTTSNASKLDN